MSTTPKIAVSVFLTLLLILASLGLFHQTHIYSSQLVPHSQRLSFLAIVCPALSVFTYAIPVVSVVEMLRAADATHFPIQVIIAQLLGNVSGVAYGILINNSPFLISSAIGLCFQTLWIIAWFVIVKHTSQSSIVRQTHPSLATLLLASLIAVCTLFITYLGRDVVGIISCMLTLLLCISPLSKLGLVVRSMNSASIPLAMSLVMLVTNAAWGIYGLMLDDIYVFLPSMFGFIITVFQIIISAWVNGVLFYDLAFLKWLYDGYDPVAPSRSSSTIELGSSFGQAREMLS
jgi:solute carrier family 50 protein (sugar transporter)